MDTDKPKLSKQQQIVIDYLARGRTLTSIVAITCLGVGSLSSRIAELRRLGYEFDTEMEVDQFERTFKKYRLANTAEQTKD